MKGEMGISLYKLCFKAGIELYFTPPEGIGMNVRPSGRNIIPTDRYTLETDHFVEKSPENGSIFEFRPLL